VNKGSLLVIIAVCSLLVAGTAVAQDGSGETVIADWLRESSGYLDMGRADLAVKMLTEATGIAPDNGEVWLSLGRACAAQGDLEPAITSFRQAIKVDSTLVEAHCGLGYCLSESGHDEQGAAALQPGLAIDPAATVSGFIDILCGTSNMRWIRGKLGEEANEVARLLSSIKFFREFLDLKNGKLPQPPPGQLKMQNLYRDTAYLRRISLNRLWKIESALTAFKKILDRDPGRRGAIFTVYFRRGKVLMEMGALEAALAEMEKASKFKIGGLGEEGQLTIQVHIGMILHEMGRLDQSLKIFKRVVRLDPEHVFALYYRGHVLRDLHRFTAAAASYDRALVLNPDLDDAWHMKGKCHLALDQTEEALTAFHWAVLINDTDPRHYNLLGVVLLEKGSRREAEENFRHALKINPRHTQAWFNLGRALELTGRRPEALAAYREAVRLESDYAQGWNNVGSILSEMGRQDESVLAFRRALDADPDLTEAAYNLGASLRALRQFTEAAEVLESATVVNPDNADIWRELGVVREKQNLFEDAILALERSTSLDNNNFQAWFTLARVHEMLGHERETVRATEMMRTLDPDLAEALLSR
jgi:tetratricopeptide (TPR) repeat protein